MTAVHLGLINTHFLPIRSVAMPQMEKCRAGREEYQHFPKALKTSEQKLINATFTCPRLVWDPPPLAVGSHGWCNVCLLAELKLAHPPSWWVAEDRDTKWNQIVWSASYLCGHVSNGAALPMVIHLWWIIPICDHLMDQIAMDNHAHVNQPLSCILSDPTHDHVLAAALLHLGLKFTSVTLVQYN